MSASDENHLSSQIKVLKRAAAANRAKSTLAGGPVPNGPSNQQTGPNGAKLINTTQLS